MIDVFSTHTSDSYMWRVLVIKSGLRCSARLKMPRNTAFVLKWRMKNDKMSLGSCVFFCFCFFLRELIHWCKKEVWGSCKCTDHWDWEIKFRDWGCSMNINDITTVIKEKCCLNNKGYLYSKSNFRYGATYWLFYLFSIFNYFSIIKK